LRLLLDTHALLWWLNDDPSLSRVAHNAIAEPTNDIFVSAASAWEIATKHRIGRLPEAALLAADMAGIIASEGFGELAISMHHGQVAGSLPGIHKDPFDRILVAQAILADLPIISSDEILSAYGVSRVW
jgi:PIN domain nuclease of toxin-antitoxin system